MDDDQNARTPERMDIVTVVYRADVALLKLQARSIRKFFRPRDIGTIIIAVNEMAPERTYSALKDQVVEEYGELIRQVEILPASHLMRPRVNASGWQTQQSLKVLVSSFVNAKHYLVLDAKHHFIRPVTIANFLDRSSGKMRSFRLTSHGALGVHLKSALEYFALEPREYTLPATAPYVMLTSAARTLVSYVEDREQETFDDFMHQRGRQMTEFYLYYAFLEAQLGGADAHYKYGARGAVQISARHPSTQEKVDAALETLREDKIVCFGLHKTRAPGLTESNVSVITDLWTTQGLFATTEDARAYFDTLLVDPTTHAILENA